MFHDLPWSMNDGYLQWMLLEVSPCRNATSDDNLHNVLTELKSCSIRRDLHQGSIVHRKAVESQNDSNKYVVTALIRMYAKCGSMVDARRVFDSIDKPNVVSWTALLMGYAENGNGPATLELFSSMRACACTPNAVTYVAALKACTSLVNRGIGGQRECLKRGKDIHSQVGCHLNIFVQNTLIDMYGKCGSMDDARRVFDSIEKPNVVSWTALLSGYADNGDELATLDLFLRMKASDCAPNSVTYLAALKACASLAGKKQVGGGKEACLKRGREIHSEIGCDLNIFLQNTLIDMYANCGSMFDARCVFNSIQNPTVVSWTLLLMGYAENGDGLTTLGLFSKMKTSGCMPDSMAYVAALKACTSLAGKQDGEQDDCLKQGRRIHSEIGCDTNIFVQSSLIDMYAKFGSMSDAYLVFESIQKPNVVCWTAVLMGYVENGDGLATLEMFSRMKACGCAPNSVTYIAVLKACGLIGSLALGRKFHSEINEFTPHVVTCMVDFYAKCGSIIESREVFDTHSRARDVSTWTALLAGYGSLGDTSSVFQLFERMQDEGFQPNAVTFLCILSCCSHAGLIDKAREYFHSMHRYRVTPSVMHYTCMVDVLGRANLLNEATALLRKLPCNPNEVTWMTLLGACRKWKNVEVGRYAFQSLLEMDNKNEPAYVLMTYIYGSSGLWEDQERVLNARIKLGAWKLPGQAYVYDEEGNMVKFVAGEKEKDVKNKLEQIQGTKEHAYIAESFNIQNNVADADKEEALCEKRAVAYGISSTPPGQPVRVFMNMRISEDCHGSTKIISKLSSRSIMIRDANRFHIMMNGKCSCGDCW